MKREREIIELLRKYREKSIVPDSKYAVACVIEDVNRNIYPGANIEFNDRNLGICAEGAALSDMLTECGAQPIQNVWLTGGSIDAEDENPDELLVPCGICLQRFAELSSENMKINVVSPINEQVTSFSLQELLPHSNTFGDYIDLSPFFLHTDSISDDVPSVLRNLMHKSFVPDEKKNEAVILQTENNRFFYGVYFASCCYKADIHALNMAVYNFLLSDCSRERISHIYYATKNSVFYIHPEFSALLKDAVISEITI